MADVTKGRLIMFKQGKKAEIPTLEVGEPAFCTDTYELYIGSDNGNKKVMMGNTIASKSVPMSIDIEPELNEIDEIKNAFITHVKKKDSTSTVTTSSTWDVIINEFARVVKI